MKKTKYIFVTLFALIVLVCSASNSWAVFKDECNCPCGNFIVTGNCPSCDVLCPEEPETCASLPLFKHYTVTESIYEPNQITLVLTPISNPVFSLYIILTTSGSETVLSAYCTGDEKLCRAVGNGKDCPGTDYMGNNLWCYKAS